MTLRRSEDAFVDELFAGAVGLGAPLLAAQFPRAFLDVNRGMAELDAGMFDGAAGRAGGCAQPARGGRAGRHSPHRARRGGNLSRQAGAATKPTARLAQLYRPYHAALAALVEETRARFGVAVVMDCHSMPSALSVPDIVLGDRYGASRRAGADGARGSRLCARRLFSVARNTPYAGGHTTRCMARRGGLPCAADRDQSRALSGRRHASPRSRGFEAVQARLTAALTQLTRDRRCPPRPPQLLPEAAE